jgi:hypothetical protein
MQENVNLIVLRFPYTQIFLPANEDHNTVDLLLLPLRVEISPFSGRYLNCSALTMIFFIPLNKKDLSIQILVLHLISSTLKDLSGSLLMDATLLPCDYSPLWRIAWGKTFLQKIPAFLLSLKNVL